ncbi:DUF2807 domain-containing protein [Hymenobacter aerilatus]|uniref:DUF2807 domain-containing protein n=1 Tax=Hymenobacter aerilatus TaxID=2932251 RepID=A0A8T9SZZ8_9BACT|nr:head GIN domain-containing protein [Hymenobacter aerilatus]UOR06514.1 DUF2807 domain-containing protein [Hymenobacter aerilatus]
MKLFVFTPWMLVLSLFAGSAAAQSKQDRPLSAFSQLEASGATTVYLTQGPQTSVVVEALDEVQATTKTEVRDGVLRIYRDNEGMTAALRNLLKNDKNGVKVYVTCPNLTALKLSGATDVKGQTPFTADAFAIQASGASDVTLQLNAKSLNVQASGASDVYLTGQVERQQVQVSGSSDYHAAKLVSQQATVQASGSSDAYVSAVRLESRASGSSDIHNRK